MKILQIAFAAVLAAGTWVASLQPAQAGRVYGGIGIGIGPYGPTFVGGIRRHRGFYRPRYYRSRHVRPRYYRPRYYRPRYYRPRYYRPRYYRPRIIYRAPVRRYRRRGFSAAHYGYCSSRYRSYRASDNTFQPYRGPRRQCRSRY